MIPIEVMTEMFDKYNEEKFDGKLPKYTIIYRRMRSFGRIKFKEKMIVLNPIYSYDSMCNTLLHELCHAEIYRRGNKLNGHNLKFWRLFKEVGGNITEINKILFKKAILVSNESNIKKEENVSNKPS
jgi:predicted SprT family Zn-dependent metalloprotease